MQSVGVWGDINLARACSHVFGFFLLALRFSDVGIPGGYVNPEGETPEAKGPYVRTLKDLDVTADADKQKIAEVLECALHDLSVRVTVDGLDEDDEESAAAQFIEELRRRAHLHFFKNKAAGA